MPVQLSPRQRDSLDYEGPDATDTRLMMRSLSVDSLNYEECETQKDRRAFSAAPDPSAVRRRARQQQSGGLLQEKASYQYSPTADADVFRLVVLLPGKGSSPIQCRMLLEQATKPARRYKCLSYCWGNEVQDAEILCDGLRFVVTKNLYRALQSLRKPKENVLVWLDQICINQNDLVERAHQVSLIHHIFSNARKVVVWLGEDADKSKELCAYAERIRYLGRDSDRQSSSLGKILTPKQFQDAMQKLLQRPWFQRVWVIPEVALAKAIDVVCGGSRMTWDNLVRLIRDTHPPETMGFNKQIALLGNPRQRIAIITQMAVSQRKGLLHTDVTQLLILAKSSQATEIRDRVYAFFGVTLLTTHPDYRRSVESLFVDIAEHYINSLLWDDYYSRWHGLNECQRNQQLMSILYSAGALHKHLTLPSWTPDWSFAWYQAPFWCKTDSNIPIGVGRDDWSTGIRSDFRAGGEARKTFELIETEKGQRGLKLSALILDTVFSVHETTPAASPFQGNIGRPIPCHDLVALSSSTHSYGRYFFRSAGGDCGMATCGVRDGDVIAILLAGDVPVILRQCSPSDEETENYTLLCECFIQSADIMYGERLVRDSTWAKDIMLI